VATTTKKAPAKYDSKVGASAKKNFLKVTVLVETTAGRYGAKALSAQDLGINLDDWIADGGYDGQYGRYRIQAETLTEDGFQKLYDA
jgi:hypothetical protein